MTPIARDAMAAFIYRYTDKVANQAGRYSVAKSTVRGPLPPLYGAGGGSPDPQSFGGGFASGRTHSSSAGGAASTHHR